MPVTPGRARERSVGPGLGQVHGGHRTGLQWPWYSERGHRHLSRGAPTAQGQWDGTAAGAVSGAAVGSEPRGLRGSETPERKSTFKF